jgi:hypothetical protein
VARRLWPGAWLARRKVLYSMPRRKSTKDGPSDAKVCTTSACTKLARSAATGDDGPTA